MFTLPTRRFVASAACFMCRWYESVTAFKWTETVLSVATGQLRSARVAWARAWSIRCPDHGADFALASISSAVA